MSTARAIELLELIAAPQRPDGSWDRDREACRALAEQALAELRASSWQPIETAPKDGTNIIVGSGTLDCVWPDVKWIVRPRAGARWEHFTLGALRFAPTHWMPLPAHP